MEKVRLFSNHIAFFDGSKDLDCLRVPVYVADPIDSNIIRKPHYPKELVYVDNIDRSMEEIRAQLYLERYNIFVHKSLFKNITKEMREAI